MHVLGVMKNLQLLRKIRTLVRIFFKDLKSVKHKFDDFIEIFIFTYKSTQMKKVKTIYLSGSFVTFVSNGIRVIRQ